MDEKDPNEKLFKDARALDVDLNYPSLEILKKNFENIFPKVYQKLLPASDEQLSNEYSFGMNIPLFPKMC